MKQYQFTWTVEFTLELLLNVVNILLFLLILVLYVRRR